MSHKNSGIDLFNIDKITTEENKIFLIEIKINKNIENS